MERGRIGNAFRSEHSAQVVEADARLQLVRSLSDRSDNTMPATRIELVCLLAFERRDGHQA